MRMIEGRPHHEPADQALAELRAAMFELIDANRSTPCLADPAPFTSDDAQDRAEAAAACPACPVLFECARAALAGDEVHWVWAGVDLTPRHGQRSSVLAAKRAHLAELAGEGPDEVESRLSGTAASS